MSRASTPRHAQIAGDLSFAVQFNAETPWHFQDAIPRAFETEAFHIGHKGHPANQRQVRMQRTFSSETGEQTNVKNDNLDELQRVRH